jgi:hypothetical protein
MVNTASQNEPIFARFTFPPLPTIQLVIYSTTGGIGWFLRLTAYRRAGLFPQGENARLFGLLPLPFAQAYPGPTAVFINELNARGLERAANGQIIRRCQRSLAVSYFGTENGVSP